MEPHWSSADHNPSQMSGVEKTSSGWYKPTHSRSSSTASSRHSRLNIKHWEVMDDFPDMNLIGESMQDSNPRGICEGYLMKRRKWPLKGWHKRYFYLDKGTLRYSKNQYDFSKGKMHGSMDVSLAVMSVNKKAGRIDLDAGDNLYHLKAKSHELYYVWVTKLSAHRMYKKNEAAHVHNGFLQALTQSSHLSQKNSAMPDMVQKLHSLESGKAVNDEDLQRIISMQNLSIDKPKKKPGKIWGHSRTLSRVEALGMLSSSHLNSSSHLGTSVPSIPDYVSTQLTPHVPKVPTSTEGKKLHQDICSMSLKVHASLRSAHEALAQERLRLKDAWSSRELHQTTSAQINNLCSLAELDVNSRHTKVHKLSVSSESSEDSYRTVLQRKFGSVRSSAPSVADSAAEYFDACDELVGVSSSEMSDESGLSDGSINSEPDEAQAIASRKYRASLSKAPPKLNTNKCTGRRTSLPAVCPDNSHVGLMTILYNNIGKDLSRVSMPAALNEARLSLAETLFILLLLPYLATPQRNIAIATNPSILSWERRLSVSERTVASVTLASRYGDHYEWNKVVTCIHNVLSQQRYLEHYGEVIIRNLKSSVCTCKITFVKSRYWGSDGSKNEVQGQVLDETGKVIHQFGGFWHEGIFCDTVPNPQCIWKPNPQPKNYMLYYGFSSFAMEMNELTHELKPLLPPTDTRLRPDQRLLEEGKVDETDKRKDQVEEKQRERRKILAKKGEEHIPRFFRKTLDAAGREVWLYNGTYWKIRENPGFSNVKNLEMWQVSQCSHIVSALTVTFRTPPCDLTPRQLTLQTQSTEGPPNMKQR
ncbi:Oxysterol-binding protein-related protein 6 [Triplophysa tibetana]|uniref:Oxysterol-binding protein-related protein 6 n=1 Tax=Triplophysa tibetana TaxID=1572043 RepID=A0A5A9PWT1_9TELE|nr:Oxysterol-binding protein-related protein 6 [Triplophysa tibetana]